MIRLVVAAYLLVLAILPQPGWAQSLRADLDGRQLSLDEIVHRLAASALVVTDDIGRLADGSRPRATGPSALATSDLIAALGGAHLTLEQALVLWEFVADQSHAAPTTLALVTALVRASDAPAARETMWSELAGLARAFAGDRHRTGRDMSLLGMFERHRDALLPLLDDLSAVPSSADDVLEVMRSARVFGADQEQSVAYVSARLPAAVARQIERVRGLGRPARWEYAAFESIVRWKTARMGAAATQAPRTLSELDDTGAAFIVVFNCLHGLDTGYREVMLRGLAPADLFNAVVAGEKELYRLGTSGYRNFLHAAILRGIDRSGSFEAFVDDALPRRLGPATERSARRRGVVFLRVAAAFGLLDTVLVRLRDREAFIREAIDAAGDERSFEANSAILVDVLLAHTSSLAVRDFTLDLLDHLYDRFYAETRPVQRNIYGSLLSVYQTVSAGRRDAAIDREFPLDTTAFEIPFERLFSADASGRFVHRMLMRLDQNEDDAASYATFRTRMVAHGATVRRAAHFEVISLDDRRVDAPARSIEIYVNEPSAIGLRRGLAGIADALAGQRVETVIGRGHTSIIGPLQSDARVILGDRVKDVAAVVVGACGGDASVRALVSTFGYIPFITTAATGRQVVNDAIISAYADALMALAPGAKLAVADVLDKAVARFVRPRSGDAMRSDAAFYQVNMAAVLTAQLFDDRVRPLIEAGRATAARE